MKRLASIHHQCIALLCMEDRLQKSMSKDLEVDAFDMLDGKMNSTVMERLHRQICEK